MRLFKKPQLQWIMAITGLFVALLACTYIYFFHIRNYGVSSRDGWYFEQEGYQKALELSYHNNRPMLLYFRRKACHICKKFEKDILNNRDFIRFTKNYLKVRYTIDLDRKQKLFSKKYNIRLQPAIFVQFQENSPLSTHLVLPMQQIWVARTTMESGNFMPLSAVTIKLSLKRITEIARRRAMLSHQSKTKNTQKFPIVTAIYSNK
ncbi:MAG: hypothetical protein CENE_00631 [Candidatus Celerinatantimonas neptuna]|nr:MAG: hypothetical protein CENE_00631 [Candidatus Celerinatantimonas neptuna]